MTVTEAQARFRPSLATSIFALFVLLIATVVGTTVWLTWQRGSAIAARSVGDKLATAAIVQAEIAQRRLEEIEYTVKLIAADPSFVAYIADAQGMLLGLGESGGPDAASIRDLLRERQEAFKFDLGIVLDNDGNVLARTDEVEAFDMSLRGDPFFDSAFAGPSPISGYWRQGRALYQAAVWPLAQDGDLAGFLLLALAVDNAVGMRVGRASGADVAYLLPVADAVELVGSSFEAARAEALIASIASGAGGISEAVQEGRPLERVRVDFDGQTWVGTLAAVEEAGGSRLGAVLRLTSESAATAGYREILNLVGLVGLVSLLVALPLSFLLARVTLRPLVAMAKAAREAAAGNYQTRIGMTGDDELAQLGQSFDTLLSDLREKSDVEGYMANLSRFLPDAGGEPPRSFVTQPGLASQQAAAEPAPEAMPATPPPPPPPVRETLLLLAFDLRQIAKLADTAGDSAMDVLGERRRLVDTLARRQGGELVAEAGVRLTVGFAGEDRLLRALGVARDLLSSDGASAAALVEGVILHGFVDGEGTRTRVALGLACQQLDRLLTESAPGRLTLPRSLGDAVRAKLGDDAVSVLAGSASGKPFYALLPTVLARVPSLPPVLAKTSTLDTTAVAATVASPALPAEAQNGVVGTPPAAHAPVQGISTPSRRGAGRAGELSPGDRLGGRYVVLSILGAGGMGVVYKARDLELDDIVALKMVKPAALVDYEHLERLKSEIKLARKITHPNVLRTFDFGEIDGLPYISMEYVRGMTLRYLLKQAGRVPYSAGLRIARQLVAGLSAAHEVGILHRDIKPENLILEASGNAKLMDFGIARPIQRSTPGQTQPGMFVGTPHYSAPEQLAGEDVDARADIYSCGVVMCEMFCGRLPFSGGNTMEIYIAQTTHEPVKPSAVWPEIPPALEATILRAIQREPMDRYQSAQELARALAGLRA